MANSGINVTTPAQRSSWSATVGLVKIVIGCAALHLFAWGPVIYYVITESPPHIRPMGQAMVGLFVVVISAASTLIVAVRQLFQRPRYLVLVSVALGSVPLGLTFGTVWFITTYLGVPFAP